MTASSLVYPSRISPAPAMISRLDPVVWGDPAALETQGPLSAAQLEMFERDGYLFLPGVFSADECQGLRAELQRLFNEPRVAGGPQMLAEPNDGSAQALFDAHRLSDRFHQLTADPRLADAARQILSSDVYIHQSRIHFKHPMDGAGSTWHADFETWHVEDGMPRMRAVSASVALTKSTDFNGPLLLVPGSHKTFVATVDKSGAARGAPPGTPALQALRALCEQSAIVAPTSPAGGVVLFDSNLMRAGAANRSPEPRSDFCVVYNSAENALADPFGGTEPRPGFMAARECTPLPRA